MCHTVFQRFPGSALRLLFNSQEIKLHIFEPKHVDDTSWVPPPFLIPALSHHVDKDLNAIYT